MDLQQRPELRQKVTLSPQVYQGLSILAMPVAELQTLVETELLENPVLEGEEFDEVPEDAEERTDEAEDDRSWDEWLDQYAELDSGEPVVPRDPDAESPAAEEYVGSVQSFGDYLEQQLAMMSLSEEEHRAAIAIVGLLDGDGFFCGKLDEVTRIAAVDASVAERALTIVQQLDPPGVGARDLRECLLLQVCQLGMGDSLAEVILLDHLKDLELRKYRQIARACKVDVEDILATAGFLATLDPKPGRIYGQEEVQYISADIFVHKNGEEYVVMLNDDGLPNLRINPLYVTDGKAGKQLDAHAEEYVNDKMRSAMWLIKSIHQRQRTIYKTAKSIVKFQREFLDKGIEYLKPLVLRDVAEDIGMHESTISRVTTNKYIHTPQGLFELKYFFNSGISTGDGDFVASESVKNRIKELVEAEDPRKPYSDQALAELLSANNINIARRTVTKYREMLRIGSSSERKRFF